MDNYNQGTIDKSEISTLEYLRYFLSCEGSAQQKIEIIESWWTKGKCSRDLCDYLKTGVELFE